MPLTEAMRAEWDRLQRDGEWVPAPGDPLFSCTFEPAGFRSWSLAAATGEWRLVLSRVDTTDREPRALVSVFASGHGSSFADLDGLVLHRTVGLYGGTNHRGLTVELAQRLGPDGRADIWARRLDYAIARTIRETQATTSGVTPFRGRLELPDPTSYVFDRRWRKGRALTVFGPGSAGKSTLADGLAVSLTSGTEIVPLWRPVSSFRVATLDYDEGRDEAAARLWAITRGHDVELGEYLHRRMRRPLADAADEVGRWVRDEGIEVVIVSPVNRALRQSSGDANGPVMELYEVLSELDVSALLVDHVVGSAIDPDRRANRAYGSVAKTDNARGAFSLYPQSEEPGRRVVILRQTKPDALAPRLPDQGVEIVYEPAWPNERGLYDAIRFGPAEVIASSGFGGDHETQPQRLARVLREYGDNGWLPTNDLARLAGFTPGHLREVAYRARKAGMTVTASRREDTDGYLLGVS